MKVIKIFAQIIGILAVITFVLSYQFKKRQNIILVNAISSILYVLQYILLGAFEGATLDVLSAFATLTAHNKHRRFISKHLKLVIILIDLAMLISGLALYKNIFSLFPVLGAVFQTGAFWLTDERKIRLISFIGAPFWLVYNIVSQAYGSVIGNVLCLISIGIAIIRYDILQVKKGEQ